MFSTLIKKLSELGDHHQLLFTMIIGLSVICISWGIEKLLEHYIFPDRLLHGSLIAIIGGIITLWITKHVILHVI